LRSWLTALLFVHLVSYLLNTPSRPANHSTMTSEPPKLAAVHAAAAMQGVSAAQLADKNTCLETR
jgi:hypothetical protein